MASYANPQSLNRYSYVLNNPIRYSDPTGHKQCEGQDNDCAGWENVPSTPALARQIVRRHGVKLSGNWRNKEIMAVAFAVVDIGAMFASTRGRSESSSQAFGAIFGEMTVGWGGTGAGGMCSSVTSGGCTTSSHQINFWSMSGHLQNDISRMVKNVVHEFGHAFDNSLTYPDPNTGRSRRPDQDLSAAFTRDTILRPNEPAGQLDWQQHPGADGPELFADMFIAWTYDAWNTNPENQKRVSAAAGWMDNLVP